MFYFLYQIKNKINNKIYIGAHKTKNLNDGYMGSGKHLKNAIKKYGIQNFDKKILLFCESYEKLLEVEKTVVNKNFIQSKNTYNIKEGGKGGFEHINNTNIDKFKGKKHTEQTKQTIRDKIKALYKQKKYKKIFSERMIGNNRNPKIKEKGENHPAFGKAKTVEHKQKISNSIKKLHKENYYKNKNSPLYKKGSEHPAHGTVWICNNITKENKKIKNHLISQFLEDGWEKGRLL
jgi:hypothetical protein